MSSSVSEWKRSAMGLFPLSESKWWCCDLPHSYINYYRCCKCKLFLVTPRLQSLFSASFRLKQSSACKLLGYRKAILKIRISLPGFLFLKQNLKDTEIQTFFAGSIISPCIQKKLQNE